MKPKHILFYILFAMFANVTTTANAQPVNVQDSLALVDLYNSTDGPNWNRKGNWLTGPVATWTGIAVKGDRVRRIDLLINNLTGTIPASIGNLTGLYFLVLNSNHLTGSIPSSLSNLRNVVEIDLAYNQLTGNIPSSLGNLQKLNTLLLGYNQLSGKIPTSLGNITSLIYLHLFQNQLDGNIPFTLGNLTNLTELSLSSNQLSGTIPSSFGNLTQLSLLELSYNQLTGKIPDTLGNLVNLTYLFLGFNQLSGKLPASLGNLAKLEWLSLGYNKLNGKIPDAIGNLGSLELLDLTDNKFTGSIPASINNLHNLDNLSLANNLLSGPVNLNKTDLPRLSSGLDISGNSFNFGDLELFATAFPDARYSQQHRVPSHQNGNLLSVSAGGTLSNNSYTWHKVGTTETVNIIGDSTFIPSSGGTYYAKIKNSVATQLVLTSDTITYTVSGLLNNFSSADQSQAASKENVFTVYPNPAKDVLHIQNAGKATVTLTNQSGKAILTKTINGNEAIDVSHLPAGIYYLKNMETKETEKILISK